MPDEIGPENEVTGEPEGPSAYEGHTAGEVDPDYLITYCDPDGDGTWTKDEDPFPYDQDDLCVRIYWDAADQDEAGGYEPAEELVTVESIDFEGELDPAGADVVVDDGTIRYCRSDDGWARDDSDPSTGYYEEWAEECAVVVAEPGNGDPPEHLGDPSSRGHVIREAHPDDDDVNMVELAEELEEEQGLTDIEFGDLEMYCTDEAGEDWYWVEGASLDEMLPGYSEWTVSWDDPGTGTCVVMYDDGDPVDDLPEVLEEGERPPEYGTPLPMAIANLGFGIDEDYELSNMLCFADGRWRRGDDLGDGCDGQFVQVFLTWMETGGGFLPRECWGTFPTTNYDIGYHSGDWKAFQRKVTGWFMHTSFNLGAGGMQVALWSLDEAYDFDIFDYETLGNELAVDFRLNLTDNDAFDLVGWCWLFLFGFVFINVLRRRAALALGELVMSVVLIVMSGVLIADYSAYMRSVWNFMDEATVAMLLVGHGEDPADPANSDVAVADVVDTVQHDLHRIFIEEPYDYINWGRHFEPGDPCGTTRNEILAMGPHGDDGEPRHMMEDAGCDNEATFNDNPTGNRLLTALMSMGTSLMAGVMVISGGLTVVAAKLGSMLLFGVGPVAMLTARLPGGGRRLFWIWLAVLAQVIAVVVIIAIVLALLLRAMLVAQGAIGEDASMVERFAVMLLLVWLVEMMRRRFLQAAQSSTGRWADNMTNFRAGGGGAPWQGPTGSRGLYLGGQGQVGRALRSSAVVGALGTAAAARAAAVPMRAAGRSYIKRADERRVANRSIRNLVNKDILAGNLAVGTPTSTRGLRQAVRQARAAHGPNHVLANPWQPPPPGRLGRAHNRIGARLQARRRAMQRPNGPRPPVWFQRGLGPGAGPRRPPAPPGGRFPLVPPPPAPPGWADRMRARWTGRRAAMPPPPGLPHPSPPGRIAGMRGRMYGRIQARWARRRRTPPPRRRRGTPPPPPGP